MKLFILATFFVILAASARGQSISQPFVNKTVQQGQTATFTLSVTGGPCRSVWTIAGKASYGAQASTFTYTTPPATAAMNGEKVSIQLYGCAAGKLNLNSSATLTVSPVITLVIDGSLRFDDSTTVYVGSLSVQQANGATWVSAGGITSDTNGTFSGFLIVNPSYVDKNGNIELQFGIANPPVYVTQSFNPAQFEQGSTGLTIKWILFKRAPSITKSAYVGFNP